MATKATLTSREVVTEKSRTVQKNSGKRTSSTSQSYFEKDSAGTYEDSLAFKLSFTEAMHNKILKLLTERLGDKYTKSKNAVTWNAIKGKRLGEDSNFLARLTGKTITIHFSNEDQHSRIKAGFLKNIILEIERMVHSS